MAARIEGGVALLIGIVLLAVARNLEGMLERIGSVAGLILVTGGGIWFLLAVLLDRNDPRRG